MRQSVLVVSKTSRKATLAVSFTLAALALAGCSKIEIKLGRRVTLVNAPVTSIEASLPQGPAMAPGQKAGMIVDVTAPDGTVLVTEGVGKGKVLWKELAVTASVVTVSKKGVLTLPRDPRVSDGKTGHVVVTVPSHPGLTAALDIPPRYDVAFSSSYEGSNGSSGSNGSDGTSGSSGSSGSSDPDNPSPGGNGGNGSNGGDGTDGGAGGDAPPVQIQVALRASTQPGGHALLQVGITATGHRERFYLVDPQGGSLTVRSEGGAGGSGGKGGRGGSGGAGGMGTPNGSNGSDGSSGRDGSSGSPGSAGSITVVYDPQVRPYLGALLLSNAGGPAPVFTEQPVGLLW